MNINTILKMAGIDEGLVTQLMTVQTMLGKLPQEKRTEIMTNFVNELENAVREVENGNQ